jgi:hypothetical protein
MRRRFCATVLAVSGIVSTAFVAPAAPTPAATRAVAIVKAPTQVTEGARATFRVRVAKPRTLRRVQLQERRADIFGNPQWVTVRSAAVRKKVWKAKATVTAKNMATYRAQVVLRDGTTRVSPVKRIRVWRWIGLASFDPYASTAGVWTGPYHPQFAMAGRQYRGWSARGDYGFWESRHTPGRNCKAFRGVLGVRDESADGSGARIRLLTDDEKVAYSSPVLTPGTARTITLALPRPYRFIVQAEDTSPEGTTSYPAIGNPAFLCTGI